MLKVPSQHLPHVTKEKSWKALSQDGRRMLGSIKRKLVVMLNMINKQKTSFFELLVVITCLTQNS